LIDSRDRPDPQALLERVTAVEERERRAKLKIFFGFAPGVGKTYAMLESARQLRAEGVDVVVACVETHGRSETARLLDGLEILPRKRIQYRGVQLEELDLDAALARKPSLLLVDELAHTNAPGSRHVKRWQDVLELLDAGIDVHTTLNVQHVESLNDIVAEITTVRVRETIPDSILDRADEIELIDLPPDELLVRLREGKVYIPDLARHAAANFFRRGNLLSLRELALRRTADHVDADVQEYREIHSIEGIPPAERLLICVGSGPGSARLLRAGRRSAGALHAPWIAATVELTTRTPLSEEDRRRLEAHLILAESLGAKVVRLSGHRVADSILEYARKNGITRILVGKSRHPRRLRLRAPIFEDIARQSGDIEVQVIGGDAEPAAPPSLDQDWISIRWRDYGAAALAVAVATGFSELGFGLFGQPDVVMLYLLAIMIVGIRFGRGPSLFAAALSVASFDFFFVPPHYTFSISDVQYALTFLMMFAVGFVISTLTSRLRFQEAATRLREERTAALLALSREVGAAVGERHVAEAICRQATEVFGWPATILLPNELGALVPFAEAGPVSYGPQESAVAHWAFELGKNAGWGTDTLPGSRIACFPLRAGETTFGVLALWPQEGVKALDRAHADLLEAFLRQSALAIEKARYAEEARTAALRAQNESLRNSLLSAVSHDLRTPIAAIVGSAGTLRDSARQLSEAQARDLLDTISEEGERLERLVSNLLQMMRLESGAVDLHREWMPLEEIVGSSLARIEKRSKERPIHIDLAKDLPPLFVDPILFEQLLINLLENALKHTPEGTPIDITAQARLDHVHIEIADRGPGIAEESRAKIFEKFMRGDSNVPGTGLGLAICAGIVTAHGGSISAQGRDGGGAVFQIDLPIGGEPPAVATMEETRSSDARS